MKAGQRAAAIAGGMLGFARKSGTHRQHCDIARLVEEVLILTEKDLSKNRVHVETRFHARPTYLWHGMSRALSLRAARALCRFGSGLNWSRSRDAELKRRVKMAVRAFLHPLYGGPGSSTQTHTTLDVAALERALNALPDVGAVSTLELRADPDRPLTDGRIVLAPGELVDWETQVTILGE